MSTSDTVTKEMVSNLIDSTFNSSDFLSNKINNIIMKSKITTSTITSITLPPPEFTKKMDSNPQNLIDWLSQNNKFVINDLNMEGFGNFLNLFKLPINGEVPENKYLSNVNLKGKLNIIHINCLFNDNKPEGIINFNIVNQNLMEDKFDFGFFESKILKEPLSSKSFDKMQLSGTFIFDYPPDVLIFKNSSIKAGCTIMTFKPITIIGYNSDISNIKVIYKNIVWLYNNTLTQKPCPVCPQLEQKTCPTQQPCPEQNPCPTQQPCPAQQPCPEIKETSGQNYSLTYWIIIGVLFVLLAVSIYKNFKNTSHKSNESDETD